MMPVIITHDWGGSVASRYYEIEDIRASGQKVVIDGQCFSACSLYLSLPANQVCVTNQAVIGVHKATMPAGTDFLMARYPIAFRQWIESRGGLKPDMMYISGKALARFIPPCVGRT